MFNNQKIFVSGGTGSWGHELVSQLLKEHNPEEVRVFSRGEHKQVDMKFEFDKDPRLNFIIGDVRDRDAVFRHMKGIDYVFHLAALKHVPVCENNSWEAVLTNVYGTHNIIEAAIANDVKRVVDISTDKAVAPFNLYGITKACGERLIINANDNYHSDTKFVCIRGGNVLGTTGSVIPLFKKQLAVKNSVTITDGSMTRYLMSTSEAISLVFKAVNQSVGGETFVMRMPATTVENIANAMIDLFGDSESRKINIGIRPGEKKHEVLISNHESPFTRIFDDEYYVILPQLTNDGLFDHYSKFASFEKEEFSSKNAKQLTKDDLIDKLKKENWLWSEE